MVDSMESRRLGFVFECYKTQEKCNKGDHR